MHSKIVIALIVVGAALVVAPMLLHAYDVHQQSNLVRALSSFHHDGQSAMGLVSEIVGALLIVTGIGLALRGNKSS